MDNSTVILVTYLINDIELFNDTTAPYIWSWDTTKFTDGNYVVSIKVMDCVGNIGIKSYMITVKNTQQSTSQDPTKNNPSDVTDTENSLIKLVKQYGITILSSVLGSFGVVYAGLVKITNLKMIHFAQQDGVTLKDLKERYPKKSDYQIKKILKKVEEGLLLDEIEKRSNNK